MHAKIWITSALWGALCAYASVAVAQSATPPVPDAAHRLVDAHGMTLYTYDRDAPGGVSRCDGICARLWPPSLASDDARPAPGFGVSPRNDGTRQWTYLGHPLYRYAGDAAPGAVSGNGVNGSWHVALVH